MKINKSKINGLFGYHYTPVTNLISIQVNGLKSMSDVNSECGTGVYLFTEPFLKGSNIWDDWHSSYLDYFSGGERYLEIKVDLSKLDDKFYSDDYFGNHVSEVDLSSIIYNGDISIDCLEISVVKCKSIKTPGVKGEITILNYF